MARKPRTTRERNMSLIYIKDFFFFLPQTSFIASFVRNADRFEFFVGHFIIIIIVVRNVGVAAFDPSAIERIRDLTPKTNASARTEIRYENARVTLRRDASNWVVQRNLTCCTVLPFFRRILIVKKTENEKHSSGRTKMNQYKRIPISSDRRCFLDSENKTKKKKSIQ